MLITILPLAGLGTLLGFLLGVASRVLHVERSNVAVEIEELLPGTQCGQCGNPSCGAAAEAVAEGQLPPTFCPPGGRAVAEAIAAKLGVSVDLSGLCDEGPKLATINEELCIGCTRCYKACPTDAILGAAKQMHVVFAEACTACGQCEDVCPTECIRLEAVKPSLQTWAWSQPDL
ncbi:RnfABCDGE type electron transport complex subunit B [Marinospirillum sp.]|uniref:RnfABCDGE type electron transport complex subunit B n=1 Tax=Marinospirillum sp. TaxID=2183934 RepID=UPI00286FCD65|nr:RnfABCDGE type electron transport complex subunit B [Marinospirillum sp.]MDR9467940.1 RnfABCDGE type electron transport complex subunit B [Marinospirillum sp.]